MLALKLFRATTTTAIIIIIYLLLASPRIIIFVMQNILYLFNLINYRDLLYIYYKKMESIYYWICSIC